MTLLLHDQKGNSTLQKYSSSQKYKTQKLRQMTYSSAQTKKLPKRTSSLTIFFLRWNTTHTSHSHTYEEDPGLVEAFLNVFVKLDTHLSRKNTL